MIVLVSDTSVLIDLERGGLLEAAFSCGLTMVVPDRPDHALVSGDKLLRTQARARQCAVYGLLWLLDQMEASAAVSTTLLHEGLTRIANHPRCRLPRAEVQARLRHWSSS